MSKIKEWFDGFILKRVVSAVANKVVVYLDGKKTAIGAVSLLLWILIYAVPVVAPEYTVLVTLGSALKVALEGAGLKLDSDLLITGTTLTVVGVMDKIRKYIKEGSNV